MTRIISILAGKGGVGKTTVATNLASALGSLNKKVGLVDFNFTTSHLSVELGLIPQKTLNHVLRNETGIENALYPCFNFSLVPASLNLPDLADIELSDIKNKISTLLNGFEVVLLDSAPGFGREALAALQASHEVILVANPTMSSVLDAVKCKQLARQLGVTPLGVVVNKYRGEGFELKPSDISNLIELPLLAVVKEDEEFLKSEATKTPLFFYKRNKAEEFFKLASRLTGAEYKKQSVWGRFLARFKRKRLKASPSLASEGFSL